MNRLIWNSISQISIPHIRYSSVMWRFNFCHAVGAFINVDTMYIYSQSLKSLIAKYVGPTWGPPGSWRPQMGPMLAPWTLLSGITSVSLTSSRTRDIRSVYYTALCIRRPSPRQFPSRHPLLGLVYAHNCTNMHLQKHAVPGTLLQTWTNFDPSMDK